MRAVLTFLLMTGIVIAADNKELVLDKSPRAHTYGLESITTVTKTEFREMQRRYRPQDFDMWAKRLRQLRPGMTEKQINQAMQPHAIDVEVTSGDIVYDSLNLSDAYFAAIFIDPRTNRMISATPPLARTYEIKPAQKK